MAIVISGVNNNDKITASDGTIDLLSGVNYAGIITAPAFTTPGNITAGHINIGSNIQLGNAGVATATTFVGNLTGNVNATSNLLLQIGGSEKFRVGSSGQLGIAGANYGTSGQVLTSGGSGSAPTWSTINGTTINNNTNDYILTGTGTANTINGEANLTFNGNNLQFNTTANGHAVIIKSTGNFYNKLSFDSGNTSAGGELAYIDFKWDGDKVADIQALAGTDTTNKDDGHLVFRTSPSQGSIAERLRIGSGGEVSLRRGGISATPSLEIYGSGNTSNSVDALRFHNWGDSSGDYWRLSVNAGLNANGNDAKLDNSKNGAGITIDGRYGRLFLKTSSSSSTVHDSLIVDKNGVVRTPLQPAFRSYTTSDGNGNGVVSGIWQTGSDDKRKFDNNDDFNESNGRFTAPVDGVYQITLAWDENNTTTIVDVQINGGGGALDLYSTEPHATSGWNTHFTGSIAKLSAGDYVTVALRQTGGSYPFHQGGGRWGHFSVYLIG